MPRPNRRFNRRVPGPPYRPGFWPSPLTAAVPLFIFEKAAPKSGLLMDLLAATVKSRLIAQAAVRASGTTVSRSSMGSEMYEIGATPHR